TTGLDAESSDQVLAGLNELMKGRTTLIIAHDLHLIQRAHRILVIRRGRIEETGTHAELLRRGGLYASLHARRLADRDDPASPALASGCLFPSARTSRQHFETRLRPLAAAMRGRPEVAAFSAPAALLEPLSIAVRLFPIDADLPTLVAATDPTVMLEILRGAL